MHIKKTMLFAKRFNAVSFLVCFLVSISISIFAGYHPVLSLNPPRSLTQLAPSGTIVDVVSGNGSFNTLVRALNTAELIEMLNSQEQYTIFAPTDNAFKSSLSKVDFDKLFNPANKDTLKKILTYHIVKGSIKKLKSGSLKTVEGRQVKIQDYNGRIRVNRAEVIPPYNLEAGNGFIYAINQMIILDDLKL